MDELQRDVQPETPSAELGTDGALTARCTRCAADVVPTGKGHCPACGGFLPANVAAVTHGARRRVSEAQRTRRADILELLIAERGGPSSIDTLTRILLEDYATAAAQLEHLAAHLEEVGAMTDRGRRRSAVDVYRTFSERVDRLASQIRGDGETVGVPLRQQAGIAQTPTPALELAQQLLSRLENGETLTEREHGALDVLRSAIRAEVALPPQPAPLHFHETPDGTILLEPGDDVDDIDREWAAPAREPATGDSDAELKEHDLAAWRAIHYNDADEIERRQREATDLMLNRIGKPSWM